MPVTQNVQGYKSGGLPLYFDFLICSSPVKAPPGARRVVVRIDELAFPISRIEEFIILRHTASASTYTGDIYYLTIITILLSIFLPPWTSLVNPDRSELGWLGNPQFILTNPSRTLSTVVRAVW